MALPEAPGFARYVLCGEPRPGVGRQSGGGHKGGGRGEPLPWTRIPGGRLVVFAASVARRWNRGPVLRAALLWESDIEPWTPHLPHVGSPRPNLPFEGRVDNVTYDEASRESGISLEAFRSAKARRGVLGRYAKCFGAPLPEDVKLHLRMGRWAGSAPVPRNASAQPCSILRFANGELEHEFLQCALPPGTSRSWRRLSKGPPKRLVAELVPSLQAGAASEDAGSIALEFCLVERPLLRLSVCTMPLYGLREVAEELPFALIDWLRYHLNILGANRTEVYDVDGSFADVVGQADSREPLMERVAYHAGWPAQLSAQMAALSGDHPSCSETWAYAHCLTTHRAVSRWVVILHSLDEYLVTPYGLEVLERLPPTWEDGDWLPFVQIQAYSFAFGIPGAERNEAESVARSPGGVLAASRWRGRNLYGHSPLLDPAACTCAGPHGCYRSTSGGTYGGVMVTADASQLVVYHYVEMLRRDRGRCHRMSWKGECDQADSSIVWAVEHLRALLGDRQRQPCCEQHAGGVT